MNVFRKLDPALKAQVKGAIIKLSKDPNTKGLRFKPLEGTEFWSIRVNRNFRILILLGEDDKGNPCYIVANAGNHDIYDRY